MFFCIWCTKSCGATGSAKAYTTCYKCGEEGHFAGNCSKQGKVSFLPLVACCCLRKSLSVMHIQHTHSTHYFYDLAVTQTFLCLYASGWTGKRTSEQLASVSRTWQKMRKFTESFNEDMIIFIDTKKQKMNCKGRVIMTTDKSRLRVTWSSLQSRTCSIAKRGRTIGCHLQNPS